MSALDELREGLREAARRDVEARRVRRRRHRRTIGAVVAVLLGGAAAATATDLISVGDPLPDRPGQTTVYRAGDRPIQIAVRDGSGDKQPFAVGVYTAGNGQSCAIVGRLRGAELGELRGGTFRPYGNARSGVCRSAGLGVIDQVEREGRVVVYGRAPRGARSVRVVETGNRVAPGPGGAFLFVYDRGSQRTPFRLEFGE